MRTNYEQLSDMHIDVLRELGNVGAGNAATSLSLMLGQMINMSVPKVNLLDFNQAIEAVGGAETLTYGVLVNLNGDISGMIMFLLNKDFAHLILNVLMGKSYNTFEELDDIARSAIQEVGNILTASYITSITEMTGLNIGRSIPDVSIDMAGALMSVPLIKFGSIGDKVLFIEDNFQSDRESVRSHMILFAEIESLNTILNKLGLM